MQREDIPHATCTTAGDVLLALCAAEVWNGHGAVQREDIADAEVWSDVLTADDVDSGASDVLEQLVERARMSLMRCGVVVVVVVVVVAVVVVVVVVLVM